MFVGCLQLGAPLLQPSLPLSVPPQQLDVVHGGLEDAALVLPDVSHNVMVGLALLWQQGPQLCDSVVDVEPPAPFN